MHTHVYTQIQMHTDTLRYTHEYAHTNAHMHTQKWKEMFQNTNTALDSQSIMNDVSVFVFYSIIFISNTMFRTSTSP